MAQHPVRASVETMVQTQAGMVEFSAPVLLQLRQDTVGTWAVTAERPFRVRHWAFYNKTWRTRPIYDPKTVETLDWTRTVRPDRRYRKLL